MVFLNECFEKVDFEKNQQTTKNQFPRGAKSAHSESMLWVVYTTQVSYRILGRGYFSTSLFAGHKYTEIEGRGSHLK